MPTTPTSRELVADLLRRLEVPTVRYVCVCRGAPDEVARDPAQAFQATINIGAISDDPAATRALGVTLDEAKLLLDAGAWRGQGVEDL